MVVPLLFITVSGDSSCLSSEEKFSRKLRYETLYNPYQDVVGVGDEVPLEND